MPCQPVISLITPSFNQGRFLAGTIESVLGQEGDFSLDYIIVDGGSTDNSVEVIKKYESLLARGAWTVRCRGINYRWISEKDAGQTDAINKGFRMAGGEILGWLNSDDTYFPGALQAVRDAFAGYSAVDIVYGRSAYIDEQGKAVGEYPTEPFSAERLAAFNFICQPSAFFRRRVLDETGYPDAALRYAMDYDLWIRAAKRHRFQYRNELLANYRLHAESKTVSARHALASARECLEVVRAHYHRAPVNRVYGYCYQWYRATMPFSFLKTRPVAGLAAFLLASVQYLILNRGIRREDLGYLSLKNIGKIFSNGPFHGHE